MDKSRTELLIGLDNLEKLEKSSVAVIGTGGVGGHTVMALARAGVENLRLVDFDKVAPSNANRQVVANEKTIGRAKVEVLKEMILLVNPSANIEIFEERLEKGNISKLTEGCDIVVDAIDSVADKIELICYCKENNIPIISAMGAGNRFDVPNFIVTDLYKTHDDGLAKVLRKKLKERGVKKLDVVCSTSSPCRKGKPVASISYYPAVCGNVIAGVIVNKIIKGDL